MYSIEGGPSVYIRIWGSEAQLRHHNRQRTYAVSLAGVITSIHHDASVQQPAGAPRRGRGAGGMSAPSTPRLGPLMTPDFQDFGRTPKVRASGRDMPTECPHSQAAPGAACSSPLLRSLGGSCPGILPERPLVHTLRPAPFGMGLEFQGHAAP